MRLTPSEIEQIADAITERLASRAPTEVLLDAYGAAELLACSVATIERLTRTGKIPSMKYGKLRRYNRDELLAKKNEKGGTE